MFPGLVLSTGVAQRLLNDERTFLRGSGKRLSMKLYLDVNYYYDPPKMFYSTEFLNGNYFFKKRKRGTFFFCVVQHSLMPTYEMSATTIETSELPVTVISRAEETILLFLNKQGFFWQERKSGSTIYGLSS